MSGKSQRDILKEYFIKHPNRDISHPEVVDWAEKKYLKVTGEKFRDPDRGIRKLHQEGFLQKIEKGVYKYDPAMVRNTKLEDFTAAMKKRILKKDGFKCVICGKSEKNGATLHVDHIKPKDKGGKATFENGQVLCSEHNFLKKNLNQTETGKKIFIRLHELAKKEQNKKLEEFCEELLSVFDKHDVNGHIEWTP